MAYSPTYTTDDIAPITIDAIGTFGAESVPFAGLLALGVILTLVVGVFVGVGARLGLVR